jgi:hypothetical protein
MNCHSPSDIGWRHNLINQLQLGASRFYLVEDSQQLMSEPGIQKYLNAQKFSFYVFENSIALRYFFESRIRNNIDSNDQLVVSVNADINDVRSMPFDILHEAKLVRFSLSDCFPDIYEGVLSSLEYEELDGLYAALNEYTPGKLGDIASRDFVLRHLYHVAPEVIQSSSDLLRTLLRLHYRDIDLPTLLKSRLVDLIERRKQFDKWPVRDIVYSKKLFFNFLQQQWLVYIEAVRESLQNNIKEPLPEYYKTKEVSLPFGHDDVRIYIDNLFLEGFLTPIEIESPEKLANHWCLVGVHVDAKKQLIKRVQGLIELCELSLPDVNARHQQWYQFAARWAELCAIVHTQPVAATSTFYILRDTVDARFSEWMLNNYHSLHNHPPNPPAMLHHIPRNMARDLGERGEGKTALILIDGLAQDQWVTLRNAIGMKHLMVESSVFAWVPTVTSVSRQALFSGKSPYQFAKTIHTTSAEPKAWQQCWVERGLAEAEIHYEKNLGTDDVNALVDRLSDHRLRAVGLVIDTVDDMMHGMLLGSAGMHSQVSLWAQSRYLEVLISALVARGFTIHITADHGNVEAIGSGKISEGAIAESRGERARVYSSENLRADILQKIPNSAGRVIAWPPLGLPADYWPIVMTGREAFVAKNEKIVGHGGIAIEEVIVPYIKIMSQVNE